MASLLWRLAIWLVALICVTPSHALFWTVTSRLVLDVWTMTVTTPHLTLPSSRPIKSGVTPTAQPVSTITSAASDDVEHVSIFYPMGAVSSSDFELRVWEDPVYSSIQAQKPYSFSVFLMPVTFTAPATCTKSFEYATQLPVYVPRAVLEDNQIKPTATVTGPHSDAGTAIMGETWYLTPSAVPLKTEEEGLYTRYIASCRKPCDVTSDAEQTYTRPWGWTKAIGFWIGVIATPLLFSFSAF